jgi:hypothetical protein
MSFLWDAVFIQVLDPTGPLMLNLSGAPYISGPTGYTTTVANGATPVTADSWTDTVCEQRDILQNVPDQYETR